MQGVTPINYYSNLAISQVTPTYTTPVQPVHRVEDYSTTPQPIAAVGKSDNAFENTLNKYIEQYKGMSHVDFNVSTPFEQATSAFESSMIVGMNVDISV